MQTQYVMTYCTIDSLLNRDVIVILHTRVNKRNSLLSAYCLSSACFFLCFAPGQYAQFDSSVPVNCLLGLI